eukprot:106055-Pleurochrysis_carterae.AAC.2
MARYSNIKQQCMYGRNGSNEILGGWGCERGWGCKILATFRKLVGACVHLFLMPNFKNPDFPAI